MATNQILKFHKKHIQFTYTDGDYWVAIKTVCQALRLNYENQRKKVHNNIVLGKQLRKIKMVAADGKSRLMLCLPKTYVYGWLLEIRCQRPDFYKFKWDCYLQLKNHFENQ